MKATKRITALQARRHLGQLLEEVHYRERSYIIERAGRQMAALVPLSLLPAQKKREAHALSAEAKKDRSQGRPRHSTN